MFRDSRRDYVFSERTRSREKKVGPGEKSSLTGRKWKYVYATEDSDELFHLGNDPLETRNVIREHPEIAEQLQLRVLAMLAAEKAVQNCESEIPPEHLEELRALGYVE